MLQTARAEAKVWKPDAALITEVTWLSWPVTAPDPNQMAAPVNGWGTFVFASGGERLAIVVDRGSGFILGMHPKSFGLAATGTLDQMNPTITAETALVTAELLGGREYRAACPEHRDQTKVGAAKDPKTGRPTWVVTYADDRSSSLPDIIVIVDATTGAVEQKTINLPSCEQS